MKVVGFRCSNTDYSFAVLEGTRAAPQIIKTETVAYPKSFSRPEQMLWLKREFDAILKKHNPALVAYKKPEAIAARGNSMSERIQCEGLLYLSAAEAGIKRVSAKAKNTIAKDIGLAKGRGHYLDDTLQHPPMDSLRDKSEKMKEAAWVAWSELRK